VACLLRQRYAQPNQPKQSAIDLDNMLRLSLTARPAAFGGDVVLLQEIDDGAARTDYNDQLARLLPLLPPEYVCHTTAFYWKAAYVPHPRIHGGAGDPVKVPDR